MTRLVDRFGRTGFAALSSLIWAVPMAAWAGSADLSPIDHTAYPGIALGVGALMLVAWFVLLTRLRSVPVTPRPHRLDIARMSGAEKRWALAFGAFATAAIAWINAAATVDWTPLVNAVAAGKPGPVIFSGCAVLALVAVVGGAWLCWRGASRAFDARVRASAGARG